MGRCCPAGVSSWRDLTLVKDSFLVMGRSGLNRDDVEEEKRRVMNGGVRSRWDDWS